MKNLHTHITAHPAETITLLFTLERSGKYEEAFEVLSDIWQNVEEMPDVKGFEPQAAAEILLRCGALIGFLGQNKQIPDAQEKSKDILSAARESFLCFKDSEKIAECENYLALGYYRAGELNEAELWIDESLSHHLPENSLTGLYSIINKSVIDFPGKKYDKILADLHKHEINFQKYGDNFLKGSFCTNYAVTLRNVGRIAEALNRLESAKFYHQQSKHKIYLGTVENNLAQIYKSEKCFAKAYEAIDNARNIFKKLKDRTREGFCLDTKAQIYFDEGNLPKSLETIEEAEKILRKGDNRSFLVETLSTKIKILLHLDDFSAATFCLTDALHIAKIYINSETAQRLVDDYQAAIKELQETPTIKDRTPEIFEDETGKPLVETTEKTVEADFLELVIPPTLSRYSSVQGVWISNNHLESIGLREGALAVVANEEVKRGDLAAVLEKSTDLVVCGYFDADFGMICLEIGENEPQLFDENEVEILGKIVGVSGYEKNKDGRLVVEEIVL